MPPAASPRCRRWRSLSIPATSVSLAAEPRPTYGAKTRPVWALLASPYALFLLVLLIVPFANVAFFSIHSYSPTKILLPELTFDNYRKLFDLYYLRLFGRTLRLGLVTTIVCVLLGYPLAYFLARARPRVQTVGLFLLILPLSVPGLISGCLLVYSISISAFVTPALLGNSRERMAAQQIYDEVLVSFNWPSASSLALALVALTLVLMFWALFATRRAGR